MAIIVFNCSRRPERVKCAYCSRPAFTTCEFNLVIEGTWEACGKPICGSCYRKTDKDVNHCKIHQIRGDIEPQLYEHIHRPS